MSITPWRRIGGVEVLLDSFFDLGTRWRWVVSFTPRPLYHHGKAPDTHWIGGWVGPRSSLDTCRREKFPSTAGIRTPIIRSSSPQSVAIPTELSLLFSLYVSILKMKNWNNSSLLCLSLSHTQLRSGRDEVFAKLKGRHYIKHGNHCLPPTWRLSRDPMYRTRAHL
jgi:hypothetical protein